MDREERTELKTRRAIALVLSAVFMAATLPLLGGPGSKAVDDSTRNRFTAEVVSERLNSQVQAQIDRQIAANEAALKNGAPSVTVDAHGTLTAAEVKAGVDDKMKGVPAANYFIAFLLAAGSLRVAGSGVKAHLKLRSDPAPSI
jgi:hypothetical protein